MRRETFSSVLAEAPRDGITELEIYGGGEHPPAEILAPPFLRRVSGSERGGWQMFCRLLLWATRNSTPGA